MVNVQKVTISATATLSIPRVNGGVNVIPVIPPFEIEQESPSYCEGQLLLESNATDVPMGTVIAAFIVSDYDFTVKLGTRDPIVTKFFGYSGDGEVLTVSNPSSSPIYLQRILVHPLS